MSLYNPMRPLNPVQAIGTAIHLYRSHYLTYAGIALTAVGWSLLPSLSLFLLMGIVGLLQIMAAPTTIIVLCSMVLIVLWIIVLLYCMAKSLMNNALISRLAFQELIQQPESVPTARRFLRPRMWNILLVQILTGLLLFGIYLGVVFAAIIFDVLIFFIDLEALLSLVILGVYYWLCAHFFIPEIPIAIEENIAATDSINRSWKLSQGSALRILLIIVLGGLLTIPFLLLAIAPIVISSMSILPDLLEANSPNEIALILTFIGFQLVPSILLSVVLFWVLNLVLLSFWQSIKAVIYYNLRSRQEGVDLKLAHRTSTGHSRPIPPPSFFNSSPSSTPPMATGSDISQPTPDISASSPPSNPAPTQPQQNTSLEISTAAEPIAQQLQQMEVDFSRLEAKHWQAIENYLQRRTKLDRETKQQTGLRLAKGIKKVLGIKQFPQKMTADLFLEAVYCVYRSRS